MPKEKKQQTPIIKGESVKILIDYDLFDVNVNGLLGVYISSNSDETKILVYFHKVKEWGEFKIGEFKRVKPGFINKKNKEFISRVRKL